jgi:hypothetical protein
VYRKQESRQTSELENGDSVLVDSGYPQQKKVDLQVPYLLANAKKKGEHWRNAASWTSIQIYARFSCDAQRLCDTGGGLKLVERRWKMENGRKLREIWG